MDTVVQNTASPPITFNCITNKKKPVKNIHLRAAKTSALLLGNTYTQNTPLLEREQATLKLHLSCHGPKLLSSSPQTSGTQTSGANISHVQSQSRSSLAEREKSEDVGRKEGKDI